MSNPNINVLVGGPVQTVVPATYKTKILKGNLDFASQVVDTDTKYVIRYDFVLNEDVTIPANCILEFDGGSIKGNNTLHYNDTLVAGDIDIDCVCQGSVRNEYATPQMYGAKGDNVTDDTIPLQNCLLGNNNVRFSDSNIYIVSEINPLITYNTNKTILLLHSNQYVDFNNATIKKTRFDGNVIRMVSAWDSSNVNIKNLILIGDFVGDSEGGNGNGSSHGISYQKVTKGSIKNVTVKDQKGDGIYIGNQGGNISEDIVIEDCVITNCYRHGASVTGCHKCIVRNVDISNIWWLCGIDFEPATEQIALDVNNIYAENVNVHDFNSTYTRASHLSVQFNKANNIHVKNITTDSTCGDLQFVSCGEKIEFADSNIDSNVNIANCVTDAINLDNCHINYILKIGTKGKCYIVNSIIRNIETLNGNEQATDVEFYNCIFDITSWATFNKTIYRITFKDCTFNILGSFIIRIDANTELNLIDCLFKSKITTTTENALVRIVGTNTLNIVGCVFDWNLLETATSITSGAIFINNVTNSVFAKNTILSKNGIGGNKVLKLQGCTDVYLLDNCAPMYQDLYSGTASNLYTAGNILSGDFNIPNE